MMAFTLIKNSKQLRFAGRQQGIALLEVLIAMFLFAVSILGYSQLQMRSIHESYDGQQRAIAIRVASGLVDRMAVNTGSLPAYSAEIGAFAGCADNPPAACAVAGAACTGDQVAAYDVWFAFCGLDSGVADTLTNFNPTMTCPGGACAPGQNIQLTMQWVSKIADSNSNIAPAAVFDQVQFSVLL